MKLVQRYNGTDEPQYWSTWSSSHNICQETQVWIDGVLSPNPFYFTFKNMLEHFTDVDFDVERLHRKWGEIVICKIKLDGQNIHELNCGFAMSEWAAKQTRSYDLTYDHETGRTHRKLVTNFTQFPTIKPQDYEILAKFLDLPSLKSTEFTGGLKNADGAYLPLWECFK